MTMSNFQYRLVNAVIFALSAAATAIYTTGFPHTAEAWVGVAVSALIAGYGKFSTSHSLLSPTSPYRPEEPKQ